MAGIVFYSANCISQAILFSEDFNAGSSTQFALNTSDLGGANVVNSWVINNAYLGGNGIACGIFPFTVPASPSQPAGITNNPGSHYLHIANNDAVASGVLNSSFGASDGGICYPDETNFAKMSSDISTVGYSSVTLSFWWACQGAASNFGEVYYSVDGGNIWTETGSITFSNQSTWQEISIQEAAFDNQASLRFAFRFNNTFDPFGIPAEPAFQVDDIEITGVSSCPAAVLNSISPVACLSYTAPSGAIYDVSGIYEDTLFSVVGCDSVITAINLTIDSTGVDGNGIHPILDASVLSDSMCFGALAGSIQYAASGGFGILSMLIVIGEDSISGATVLNSNTLNGLSCDSVFIVATGADGCVADTALSMPCYTPVGLEANILTDETCYLNYSGSIELNCLTTNAPVSITFNGESVNCGDVIDSLTCGNYLIAATGANGCDVLINRSVSCPASSFELSEMVASSVTGTICPGSPASLLINCPSSVVITEIEINDSIYTSCVNGSLPLSCGQNLITVTESGGCYRDTIISVSCFEMPQVTANELTPESCYLVSDGSIEVVCSGITPTSLLFNGQTISCNSTLDSLTCGDYVIEYTNAEGCLNTDSLNIDCPTRLYDFTENLSFNGTPLCVESTNGDTLFFNPDPTVIAQIKVDGIIVNLPVIEPLGCGDHLIEVTQVGGCYRDTIISIPCIEEQFLNLTIQNDVYCFGDSTGAAALLCDESAFDNLEFDNIPAVCGQTFEHLACGQHIAEGFYAGGCVVSDTININCPLELELVLTTTDILCYGDDNGQINGFITGGNGSFYSEWRLNGNLVASPSDSDTLHIDLIDLDGGDYGIFILDSVITLSGNDSTCLVRDTLTIIEPEEYLFTKTITNASCFGYCDGAVDYEVSGGNAPYEITITDTIGTPANINALCAGVYVVEISDDNQCLLFDTIEISEPDSFQFAFSFERVSCFGICDGIIDITDVTGSNGEYSYSIFPASGTCGSCSGNSTSFTGLCSSDYVVTIQDSSSCFVDLNITIATPQQLDLIVSRSNVTCFGLDNGWVSLSFSGGTAPVTADTLNLLLPDTLFNLSPQWYHFVITDSSGCTAIDSALITEPALLEIDTQAVNAVSCGNLCDGSIVYIPQGGTPPYNYFLSPDSIQGAANGNIFDLCAGIYELFITDIQNCSDSIEFTVNSPTLLEVNSVLDPPTCTGMFDGSIQLLPVGGVPPLDLNLLNLEYDLFPVDSSTYAINNLGEGSLVFLLTDAVNCRIYDTIPVVPAIITDMILNLFSSPETCWGEFNGTATVAVTNGNLPISYSWDDPNAQTNPTAVGLGSNQEFTVIVTDDIGCTLSGSVFVENTDSCLVITNAVTPNGDGINDIWVLGGLEFFTDAMIYVHNRWGQLVYSSKGYSKPWDGTYLGRPLPIGDYYFSIEFTGDKERITGTLTIKY
jgi:gliding motility-associated-like protein